MYDDLETVDHAVDRAGFVLVNGERVINTPCVYLRAMTYGDTRCQRCGEAAKLPLRVVCEYEHAIGSLRYFHAPVPGSVSLCPLHPMQSYRVHVRAREIGALGLPSFATWITNVPGIDASAALSNVFDTDDLQALYQTHEHIETTCVVNESDESDRLNRGFE
jgi:hypothetical protein